MDRSAALVLMFLLLCLLTFSLNHQVAKATAVDLVVPDDYATIQGAINAASNGYKILVRDGTYYENVVVNKTVTLCGEDREATIIDGNKTGDCVHVTAFGVTVTRFTIRNGGAAYSSVSLSSNGNTILGNDLIGSWCGVQIDDRCGNEVIESNTIVGNLNGIAGELLSEVSIIGNDIKNNLMGIWLGPYTSLSVVSFNNMTDNWTQGLYSYAPSHCTFEGNNITRNNQAGWSAGLTLAFQEPFSCGNRFFHNNVANVGQQFDLEGGAAGQLALDDGYPSGGNYWNSYNGTDIFHGVFQNETGSDGIGDTPYVFDSNDIDGYPLMEPWTKVMPTALSASISPLSASIAPGQSITFTSSASGGMQPYSYQWYVNGTPVLGADTSSSTFTSHPVGNYSVWLVVTDILGSQATSSQASVSVVLVGDLNNDGKVDMKDIAITVSAFGSSPGMPRWNPQADVDNDNRITLRDIVIIIEHFGQHYP